MADRRTTLSLEELQLACTLLERACVNDGRLVDVEINARRPGSTDYVDDGCSSWLTYHGWLSRKHVGATAARVERSDDASTSVPEALRQMAHATPVRVDLELDRDAKDCEREFSDGLTVFVHPKSEPTLFWLDSMDAQMSRMYKVVALAASLESADDEKVLALGPLSHALAVRVWAWILTHAGPGLPFDPNAAPAPEPPRQFWLLTSADIVKLFLAHKEIHETRPRIVVRALSGPDPDTVSRLPLHGMLAAWSEEQGGKSSDVLNTWSLGEITAVMMSRSFAHREAMARSKHPGRD